MGCMWPTPTARDWRSGTGCQERPGHSPPLSQIVGGQLNPEWVEALMGFPIGWTDVGLPRPASPSTQGSPHALCEGSRGDGPG